jgi:hypothetical protein
MLFALFAKSFLDGVEVELVLHKVVLAEIAKQRD